MRESIKNCMILTFLLLAIGVINANTTDGLDDYVDLNQKNNIHDNSNDYHTNFNEQDEDNLNTNANTNLFNKKPKESSSGEDEPSKINLFDVASLSSNSLRVGFEPFYIITNFVIDELIKPNLPTGNLHPFLLDLKSKHDFF